MKRFITSRWGLACVGIALILFLIIFNSSTFFDPARNILSYVFQPIHTIGFSIGQRVEKFTAFFASRKELVEEVNRLQNQATKLSKENVELFQQIQDLSVLRKEMDFIGEKTFDAVPAKVIGKNVFPAPPSLLVNRGASVGISSGSAVITDDGVIIGRVTDVTSTTSLISLITDPQSEFAAKVQNETLSTGILLGSHGLGLQIIRIPYDHSLLTDQRVVTAGTEEGIPPDLYVGTIESIQYTEGELFQSAVVEPAIDFENVSIVAIIR
ncbi:MAG: hypothetical protein A2898_04270 [Candidatus Kerfeldbacteria bacterium RIFCSPLOWO2_01_FULL_48_11]|uniref:Cell shape-determining protein MreC n=1 Tax=Candidatus Kerfeldbacteria bacterium RIFCSPLOWO2_01_FULL_48_11 TaxID=1798543 RepID=A0A1G2B0R7_9BACT|nr:MAG: Cell shape-determining protein MreC [Parcubacteria group bacterium GW2011_GWA2_48_9]KKW16221.1 MAG: Cell shape-determining protein MreC [Parcubacteria group bacterium GW2011_GWC2_49_9]OGY82782.1 MAG: hypothetical protein A2898_04270 [Candidatus Kerfeldbacteria bacterium RIFCSPLOWO2_01_FULL_48_11]HCJ52668.1 hypothetical protein [Candidatus Kerfeldbacteria bacterium]HCM67768.1 hypothetical protein [Candidatus Kerfeldbacteria bacterium]